MMTVADIRELERRAIVAQYPYDVARSALDPARWPITDMHLADVLHYSRCRDSHADQCGYLDEDWTAPGALKTAALREAQATIASLRAVLPGAMADQAITALIHAVSVDGVAPSTPQP